MTLSDLSVRRPVLATVFSLIIIAFGAIAFTQLPLRELPDVDQPVVSVNATYPGASAQVVETQITRVIEDQLSGIDGVDVINATSRDGRSSIQVVAMHSTATVTRRILPFRGEDASVATRMADVVPFIRPYLSAAAATRAAR